MGKRGLTRLSSTNSLSGIIPAGNIANSTLNNITAVPSAIVTGMPELISTATASSSASIDFTSGIDSTYDIYMFEFVNIHPATDDTRFTFQADTGTNTNYNLTITSTHFVANHLENGTGGSLGYDGGEDQAQGTAFHRLASGLGGDNDQAHSGMLQVFNPSSNTFVKHFIARMGEIRNNNGARDYFTAGYFNLTTPITRFRFKMQTGDIEDGTIKMYGISG